MKTITYRIGLLLLLSITNSFLFSQYKVIYEMKWKSNKKDSIYKKELCVLVINTDNTSSFQSIENFKRDSLQTSIVTEYFKNKKGDLRLPDDRTNAKFSYIIIKNKSPKNTSIEEKLFTNVYIENCDQKLDWKLLNSNESKIFGYTVNKATVKFGNRNWTAFYTTEIPFQDGPYKFEGLPGLILKIIDDSEDYSFEIKGITKEMNDLSKRNFSYNTINLSPKKWNLFWKKYKQQPSMIFENLNTSETTFVIDGQDVSNKDVKASYDKKEKARLNYFENPIELIPVCN